MTEQEHTGWGKPGSSRNQKWHYFNNESTSLCRKWGFFWGYVEQGNDENSDNCAECKRKLKRLREEDLA